MNILFGLQIVIADFAVFYINFSAKNSLSCTLIIGLLLMHIAGNYAVTVANITYLFFIA
jgi:hypothetical protein